MFKNNISFWVFIIFTIAIISISAYLLYGISSIHKLSIDISNIDKTLNSIVVYNNNDLFAQLELWEYIYDPNQERLDAFLKMKTALNESLYDLENTVEINQDLIYENGVNEINEIKNNLLQIEQNWEKVLTAAKEYRDAKENGESATTMADLKEKLYQEAIKNEKNFDDFGFDKKVNNLVTQQENYVVQIREKINKAEKNLFGALLIMMLLYAISFLSTILFLASLAKKVNKKLNRD